MPSDNLALTWTMFLEELASIEVGEAFALQILSEAKDVCQLAGISMEDLVDYARRQQEGQSNTQPLDPGPATP